MEQKDGTYDLQRRTNSVAQAGMSGEVMYTRPSRGAFNFDEIRIGVNKHQNSSSICLKAALSDIAKDSGNRVKEVMACPLAEWTHPKTANWLFSVSNIFSAPFRS